MGLFTNSDFLYQEPLDILEKQEMQGKSEMSPWQQSFLCGLMRQSRPQKILEVGVSSGGTTAVILNCMEKLGLKETQLHSIDLLPYAYQTPEKPTGYVATEVMPHMTAQWTLHTGYMAAHWMEEIGGGIDFVVLDSAHVLPGELLDFLMILPFLTSDAFVVLHDIHLYRYNHKTRTSIASHVLFHSVVADKIMCKSETSGWDLPNIAAFQLTPDTVRYREQLFYALSLPWDYPIQGRDLKDTVNLLNKYYPQDCVSYFKNCVKSVGSVHRKKDIPKKILSASKIALWGAGAQGNLCAAVLQTEWEEEAKQKRLVFLDRNPKLHNMLLDIPVMSPETGLKTDLPPDIVIVCIMNKSAQLEVTHQLNDWGYHIGENAFLYTDIVES